MSYSIERPPHSEKRPISSPSMSTMKRSSPAASPPVPPGALRPLAYGCPTAMSEGLPPEQGPTALALGEQVASESVEHVLVQVVGVLRGLLARAQPLGVL